MRTLALLVLLTVPAAAQAPETTLLAGPEPSTSDRYAVFAFAGPEGAAFECAVDEAPFAPCASPFTALDLVLGAHAFAVRAGVDGAWDETPATASWEVVSIFEDAHPNLVYEGVLPPPDPDGGSFRIKCEVSHGAYDDPIVFPGEPGRAHLHLFLGNEAADAAATDTSLFTGGTTTCEGGVLNRSSYWLPTLLAPAYDAAGVPLMRPDGQQATTVVLPRDGAAAPDIYYKAATDELLPIQPMPRGLRMIAGDARAHAPQDLRFFRWSCASWTITGMDDFSPHVPACEIGDAVALTIAFPMCWNGVDLDAPDHHSHMAYQSWSEARGAHCADPHPVTLPQVSYNLFFPVTEANAAPDGTSRRWFLASDHYTPSDMHPGGLSVHADWFMAWHPEIVETWTEHCLRAGRHCAGGDLGNGWRLTGMRAGTGTFPETPGYGGHPSTAHGHAPAAPGALGIYPNPVTGHGRVVLDVAAPSDVTVALFDLLGRRVRLVYSGGVPAGRVPLELRTEGLSAGAYLVQAVSADGRLRATAPVRVLR